MKQAEVDGLASVFSLERVGRHPDARPDVVVSCRDPQWVARHHILTLCPAEQACAKVRVEVEDWARTLAEYVSDGIKKAAPKLGWKCRSCEYRNHGKKPEGFSECWGERAKVSPHLFELQQLGRVKSDGERLADRLIGAGKSLFV